MTNPPAFSLPDAWAHARWVLERIVALFGDPVDVRDLGEMRRYEFRALRGWLRPLEDFVRRLILIAACRASAGAHLRAPRPRVRERRRPGAPRRPSFRILPYTDRLQRAGARCTPPHRPYAILPTRAIARRFSALVGAIYEPAPLIARLARRLKRAAARVRALIARRDPRVRDDAIIATHDAAAIAFAAALPPDSS